MSYTLYINIPLIISLKYLDKDWPFGKNEVVRKT